MSSLDRYNPSGEVMPAQLIATSAALYGGDRAPVHGRADRRNERDHFTDVRQMQRATVARLAQEAGRVLVEQAVVGGELAILRERKLAIAQAQRETSVMAGDNPVLAAKMAVLDDDFMQGLRLRGLSY